ncbi:hypothetical protein PT974_04318 [Cladobotryum mycophilum]|uniref:Uncharacterized protein n=1 Tax=Cladobotryum mycophilum TaxID=491253 RepID=A0ABR0SVV9_9HYPO
MGKTTPSPEEKKKKQPSNVKKIPALWMCYSGGVGFGGYAGYGGYTRRIRLFEVDTEEARITTWKRLEHGDLKARIDEQIIVDGGKAFIQEASPPPPPPPPPESKGQ